MISGFIGVVPVLGGMEDIAGLPLAALTFPSGVEEVVMLETVGAAEELMLRGGESGGCDGLSSEGDCVSDSGEVGGESREGDSGSSSGEDMVWVCLIACYLSCRLPDE